MRGHPGLAALGQLHTSGLMCRSKHHLYVGKSQAELTQLVDEALRTQPGCETARVAAVRALPGVRQGRN